MIEYKLEINQIDLAVGEQETSFSRVLLDEMAELGFSMNGGLWVFAHVYSNEELTAVGSAYVARSLKKVEREPENGHESSKPEFMEYRAFGGDRGLFWLADLVNSMISFNQGKLPNGWLEEAMDRLEIASGEQ